MNDARTAVSGSPPIQTGNMFRCSTRLLVLVASREIHLRAALTYDTQAESLGHLSLLAPRFWEHGCYCSQVFNEGSLLDHGTPVDWSDRACFDLVQCLRCPVDRGLDAGVCSGNETMLDPKVGLPNLLFNDSQDKNFFGRGCAQQ